jgi:hypothetical protein
MKLMKRMIAWVGCLLLSLQSSVILAASGPLFDVQGTGSPTQVTITVCLDGLASLSCQTYAPSGLDLHIRSTVSGHTYPNACLKVNTPGYHVRNVAVDCTSINNGCCLFSVSDTSPKNITLTPIVPELLLYGTTGAGSPSNPNTLYRMNTSTGFGSLIMPLTDDDGAVIASDGAHIYHWTGYEPLETFERVDLERLTTTNIPFEGDPISEVFGAVFSQGSFLVSTYDDEFFTFTTEGTVTQIGDTDNSIRGFACYNHLIYAVTTSSDALYELDPSTGATLSTQTITLAGFTVEKGLGITANPTTGVLYALLKVQGSSTRKLVTIDPTTGVATLIGDANDASGNARFSSIAFHPADPNC